MEKRLRILAHIPLQPLSRISTAKEKSCAKGLFDEKYNNNPKYSLIESLQIKSQAPNGTCCKEIWQKVGRKKCSTNKPPQSAGLKREKRK